MDGRTYDTATQGGLPRGLRPHALHAITACTNDRQKSTWKTGQRGRETNRRTDRRTEYWTDGWMDGWMDGQTDGQTVMYAL